VAIALVVVLMALFATTLIVSTATALKAVAGQARRHA
jgi:hypothetical protein